MYSYEYGTINALLNVAGIPHKRVGNRYMGVCPVCGGGYKTPCCSYSPEKNVWKCFSCGESGGVRKLQDYLNVDIGLSNFVSAKSTREMSYEPADITESVKDFITRNPDPDSLKFLKNRGLDHQKIVKFIRFLSPKKKWYYQNGFRLGIPSFDREGRTRNLKIRNVFPEDVRKRKLEKDFKVISWKGGENYSIGLNWLTDSMEFCLIVEGEMDFLTVKQIDSEFPVIGLPSVNYRFKDELSHLPHKIVLLLDNDESGKYHSQRLKKELEDKGKKVKIMSYPKEKDFNDLFLANPEEAKKLLHEVKRLFRKRFLGIF